MTAFTIAIAVYSLVSIVLARGRRGRQASLPLLAAASNWFCAVAGLLVVATDRPDSMRAADLELAYGLRAGFWLWLAYATLSFVTAGPMDVVSRPDPLFRTGAGLVAAKLALSLALILTGEVPILEQADCAIGLGIAAFGLVLVENIYDASGSGMRWAVKHLLMALGCLFAFELFRYSDALLLHQFSSLAFAAQPLISVLVAPLLVVAAARIRSFAINVHVARRFVFRTSALIASGVYLLAVAAVGLLFRQLGVGWAPTLQLVSLVGALLLLTVLLSSGSFRARGRRLIERSFFSFAYDYREEWLRFVATMAGDREGRPLRERAIKAAADPLDCSAGLLYLYRGGGECRFAAQWNWPEAAAAAPPPDALLRRLGAERPADLRCAPSAGPESWPGRPDGAWILLALRAHGLELGALLLGKPRVSRELTWEDLDLLGVLAAQIGGYLAEEQTTRALAEAQRFERISKDFSFVAHDLKNIVSQLSLLLQQAKRHGDKPEFMRDTLLTVAESVDKMQAMLLRLRESGAAGRPRRVELVELVGDLVERRRRMGVAPTLEVSAPSAVVEADPEMLATVVGNLLDNAYDAGGAGANVALTLVSRDGRAVLEVRDDGPGMPPGFVEDRLFQPFASAKATGYGIGLYQCREWVERWGGRLEIESGPGVGTVARVGLPLAQAASAAEVAGPNSRGRAKDSARKSFPNVGTASATPVGTVVPTQSAGSDTP